MKRLKTWLCLVLGLIPGLMGCSDESPMTSALDADTRPQTLAMGYDSLSGEARNICLDVSSQKTNLNRVEPLVITSVKNFDEIAAAIGTNPVELHADPANSPLAAWARSLDQNPRMMTVLIRQQRTLTSTKITGNPQLPPTLLSDLAEAAGSDQASYADFVQACGDQYVEELKVGDALYGLVTIVLGKNEDVPSRLDELSNLWQNPRDLQWVLKKMPLKSVQFLYQGRASSTASASYQVGSGLESFISLYNGMVEGTRLITPEKAVPVELVYRGYLDTFAADLPTSGRDALLAKGRIIPSLRSQLTRGESCVTQLSSKLDRPFEFTVTRDLDAADKQGLEAALQTTRSAIASCLSAESCSSLTDPTSDPSQFQAACQDANFKLKTTSARLYADYLGNPEYRRILGQPLDVSRIEGLNMLQPYEKGYMVHGNYMYYTATFAMPTAIFDAWKAAEATYGRPTSAPFQKYGTHDLYRFDFAKFYVTSPGTANQKITIVKKLAAAIPDETVPTASEKSGPIPYGKYFTVSTRDHEYYIAEFRLLDLVTLSDVYKISVSDPFAALLPFKSEAVNYVPQGNPVNEARARNQDRYIKLSGAYLWTSTKGTFLVPIAIHDDYIANGGSRVLGSFKGAVKEYRDGDSLVTSMQTEFGVIRRYPLGGYQCKKSIEYLADKMICSPVPI